MKYLTFACAIRRTCVFLLVARVTVV